MPALSVILTTYNKPRDLARSLAGMAQQTFRDFELLVCDDGSGPETRALIEGFAARADFPVHHVWQEDAGFRAARSRNNGARRALGETLVFVDGDIIAFPDFLQVHHDAQRPGAFQAGERYLTTEEGGAAIEVAAIEDGSVYAQLPAGERRRLTSLRWKNRFYRVSGLKPERPALMTCNCSLSLELFRAVNGLDERYEGWGQEDEDLRRRLVMQGARPDSLIGKANGLHLWHRADASFRGSRRASPNWAYYERGFHLSRCRRGLAERALSEVRGEVLGGDPVRREALGASLGWAREPERGSPLEVALWIDDGTPTPPWPECEVRVLLSDDPQPRGLSCDLICGPGLPTAGGELPGERFDPVPDAWSGAKALRRVDASDPDAVRATLERIL